MYFVFLCDDRHIVVAHFDCVSITNQYYLVMAEQIKLVFMQRLSLTYRTLYCNKILVPAKIVVLLKWNFVPNSEVRKFCQSSLIIAVCCYLDKGGCPMS